MTRRNKILQNSTISMVFVSPFYFLCSSCSAMFTFFRDTPMTFYPSMQSNITNIVSFPVRVLFVLKLRKFKSFIPSNHNSFSVFIPRDTSFSKRIAEHKFTHLLVSFLTPFLKTFCSLVPWKTTYSKFIATFFGTKSALSNFYTTFVSHKHNVANLTIYFYHNTIVSYIKYTCDRTNCYYSI